MTISWDWTWVSETGTIRRFATIDNDTWMTCPRMSQVVSTAVYSRSYGLKQKHDRIEGGQAFAAAS
jgi:hypothetical protein